MRLDIDVYDVLVFESQDGSVIQDCVTEVRRSGMALLIICHTMLYPNGSMNEDHSTSLCGKKYLLKEIWRRTSKATMSIVWRNSLLSL